CPLAAGEGLPVVAEQGVQPADLVEGAGLPGLVAGGPEQVEGLPGVVEGLRGVALPLPQVGQVVVGAGLPDLVADLTVQVEGVAELGVGVVEATQPGVGAGEVAVGVSLCGRVGQPPGGGHRGAPGSGPVVPMPPSVEERPQGPGQLPGVGVEPGDGGM